MAQFPSFRLHLVIEKAIEEAMEGYDYIWHYKVTVARVGITDNGVDVGINVDYNIQYNTTPIVEEETCQNTRTSP